MLNLLRMDLYRMLKFKRTWVLLIIALVGWFGMSFVTHVAYEDGLKLLSQTGSTRLLTDMQVPGAAIVGKHIS
ncbi:MAG TPA: hypothetical protein DEP42_01695, partial [Ruminococcaceae bacterium]|nr:hypothetical protein [Oscillospiraceae bacterium]